MDIFFDLNTSCQDCIAAKPVDIPVVALDFEELLKHVMASFGAHIERTMSNPFSSKNAQSISIWVELSVGS